jgi:hypothetical protein
VRLSLRGDQEARITFAGERCAALVLAFFWGSCPLFGLILIGAVPGGAYCQGVRTGDRERFGTAPPVRQPVSHLKRSVDA